MSAVDQMREMINQLMGTDPSVDDGRERLPFTDVRICRNFLLGCCPHDILASTRMDMGECQKIHDVALRADFERSQKEKDYFYDLDAFEVLERFFYDCDRKMDIAKKKLAETQEELSQEATEKAEKVLELNENIGKTLAEAEKLGNEGRVEESLALMEKLDSLKKEKQDADQEYRSAMPASSYQQQKLRVCEVCSAYLGIHDNDRRLADHFGGKLHVGFVFLRDKLAELKVTVEQRRAAKEAVRRGSYGGDRDKEKDRGKGRDYYERRRSRSPRDRGDRRDRSDRDRERDRDRDRDKDKDRSSRHRDHKDTRGDRDKDRDRDRDRGDRRSDRGDRGDRDRGSDRRRDRGDRDRGSDRDRRSSKHSRRSRSKSRDRSTGESSSSKNRADAAQPELPKEEVASKPEQPSPPGEPSGEPSPGEIRSENGDSKKEHFSDVDD